tara:strand:+ start:175 stop:546 length:372 start_codon:yes stop_codon:yes gene_type:complete
MMPYLAVEDPDGLVQFVKTAFDAECVHQLLNEDGSVYHSEFRIGSAHFMIGRVPPDADCTPASLYVYTEDCDAIYQKTLEAGAEVIMVTAGGWRRELKTYQQLSYNHDTRNIVPANKTISKPR